MNHNRSVATIDAPEFINLEQDAINPGISKCEIKVFYLGENRNHSFINRNTAIQMANSLPGTPIVGAYRKDIEDFGDHGHVMHIEDGEIQFSCKTIPYGFVAPDAEVWFQKFIDTDEFDNEIEREYLMTIGYLWTAQYPEVTECVTAGKGQSMELDEETLDGHWATNNNTGIEFFIINDAIFTKLCILGDDVEPCFEGAAVTSPEVSKNFSKDGEFSHTLFTMMNELKDALKNKGGSDMPKTESQLEVEVNETETEEEAQETVETEESTEESEDSEADEGDADDADGEEFACGEGKKKKYADTEEEEEPPAKEDQESDEDGKKKPAATNSLDETISLEEFKAMKEEIEQLRQFKLRQDNLKKNALINKYHMLSDEDKADVIANKEQYSYEEIESKLALKYVQKNVNFSSLTGESVEESEAEEDVVTFSLDNEVAGLVPPFVEALRQAKRNQF